MNNQRALDISWETIFRVSLVAISFYVLYLIKDILILFIFALMISVLFNPAIDFLQKRKIPRILGVIIVYIGILGIFSISVYAVVPLFASEIQEFLQSFPQYFEKVSPLLKGLGFQAFRDIESFLKALGGTLEKMVDNIFGVLFTVFGGVFSSLFVIVIAVFLSLEEKTVEKVLILLFPRKYESYVLNLWGRCQKKISGWFGARILACLFVGIFSYVTFLLFNVKYPFALALFAGVFNFVPYFGPLLTEILLFLIIFPTAALKAIFVLIAFVLIQQIENNILSPILLKKFVGFPPALILVSLVIGGQLWGFLGALLAVPLFGILFEFLKEFLQKRKDKEVKVV